MRFFRSNTVSSSDIPSAEVWLSEKRVLFFTSSSCLQSTEPIALDLSLKKSSIVKEHQFKVHSYMRPTFCAVCNKLLKGLMRQGQQCELCGVDVHKKCQTFLNPCSKKYGNTYRHVMHALMIV